MHGDGDGGHNVFETLLLPQRTQAAIFFITDSLVLANEGVSQPMSTTAECPKVKQNLSKKMFHQRVTYTFFLITKRPFSTTTLVLSHTMVWSVSPFVRISAI